MASTIKATATAAITYALLTASLAYYVHRRSLERVEADLTSLRQAERTGRIRAEVKLRTLEKEQQLNGSKPNDSTERTMVLKCIGTVVSPYTKRMGTPRQGALAPDSRGFIQIHTQLCAIEALDHIDLYSHAWILFGFHANTDQSTSRKSKVKPPRSPPGVKVGQLATRSPHRPNPIGLSLVKVQRLDKKEKRLYISALDLVNNTPVYDIKPVVPWDVPGHYDGHQLTVPEWVSQEDELSEVQLSKNADEALQNAVSDNLLAPLYANQNGGYQAAKQTLQQVLSQDPRAANKRGSVTQSSESAYKIIFGGLQVEFIVQASGSVIVEGIQPIEFESSAYVDGIPLASESRANDGS